MKEYTLSFLGKDSGFGKNSNSAYLETDKELIIIDCGFSVFEKVKEKFDLSKYNSIKVIITHLHNDHAGSLSQLILYCWYIFNKRVTVMSKCENIEKYLEITGTPREAYELKNDYIEFIKTEHVKYLDAYGFYIKLNEKNIVYTGDTNTIEPFLNFIEKADEIYIDVSRYRSDAHINIEDVVDILKEFKEKGKKVILMHLDDKDYIEKVTNGEFYI